MEKDMKNVNYFKIIHKAILFIESNLKLYL